MALIIMMIPKKPRVLNLVSVISFFNEIRVSVAEAPLITPIILLEFDL